MSSPRASGPPSGGDGTITFLFTDIEGSTKLLKEAGADYAELLDTHRRLLRTAFTTHRGREVDTQGDSFFVAFSSPSEAVAASMDAQRALAAHDWPSGHRVRVRMGVHTGEATAVGDSYVGLEVHRGARIGAVAHGEQVLVSETTAALVRGRLPDGAELRDMGEHRLKDLDRPERLYQLVAPGLASDFPAPTTARAARRLQGRLSRFIGREAEVAALVALLQDDGVRLVTLTGPGGTGKTRLAIAVGEQLDASYQHGTVFVALEAVAQPELVLPRIADAMGVTTEGSRPAMDVLVEHLVETRTLLVLDNLEQVVSVAPEIDELLARWDGLKILATSRTVLRLRAEREFPVSPLTVPAFSDRPPLEQLASLPAVRLFVDRAQAIRYDFALTEDNTFAVVEICRRLDGLPLAIELAAARTRLLEPGALLARLGSSFDALGTGSVDLPERQRTLRATVEWSVGLLDDAEQHMLAILSVFVEGWTVDAAVHVSALSENQVLDRLDALAGHSLVNVDATDVGLRFRMLVSVRELAAERLAASADQADVERRHAQYFGALVENADWPAERQAEWAERLRTEEDNLRIAIRWFLTHDVSPLPHLFRILWLFWQMRSRMPEGRAWIDEVQLKADVLDDRAQAELLFTSAVTAVEIGDDDSALAAVEGLKRLEGSIDDPYLKSAAQLAISWILPIVDDFDGALHAASTALDGFRQQNEPFMAFAALTVGMTEAALGRFEAARAHLIEVNELGGQFDNNWLESTALTQLASLAVRAGHLDEARALLTASVDVGEETELSALTVTFSLVAAAGLARAEGDIPRAALALGAADGLRRRAGLRAWPSTRRGESELAGRVAQEMDPRDYERAFAAGSELRHRDAVALVRGGSRGDGRPDGKKATE